MISNFFLNFSNFCFIVSFLTKLLTLGILFSTAVKELVVAKLLILGISHLTSFILSIRVVLVAMLLISGILSSVFFILALYKSFYKQHHFLLHCLVYLNQQEQVLIYQHLIYLFYFSNCVN